MTRPVHLELPLPALLALLLCACGSQDALDAGAAADVMMMPGASDAGPAPEMDAGIASSDADPDDADEAAPDDADELDPDDAAPPTRDDAGPAGRAADGSADAAASRRYQGACEIGVTDAEGSTCFVAHDEARPIPLVGGAQADLLVELALRARDARGAAADVVLTAIDSGRSTRVTAPPAAFDCDPDPVCADLTDARWCKVLPLFMETYDLVDDPFELADLPVRVEMSLRDADGVFCTAAIEGTLHRR